MWVCTGTLVRGGDSRTNLPVIIYPIDDDLLQSSITYKRFEFGRPHQGTLVLIFTSILYGWLERGTHLRRTVQAGEVWDGFCENIMSLCSCLG